MRSKTWTLHAISLCLLPLLTAGCLSDNLLSDHPDTPTGPIEIRMKSYIAGSTMGTRADDVKGIIKEGTTFNVSFAKADEGSSDYSGVSFSLVNSTGTVSSSSPYNLTFNPAIYYQTTKSKKTKLIGWHPAGGTLSNGAVTFSTALDGETDVMATSLVEGCQTSTISSVTFDHLLTQISVKVYATDDATKGLWGGIKSIKVKGKKQSYMLTLPATSATAGTKITTVGFTGSDDLPLVQKDPSNNTEIQQESNAYGESNALVLGSSDSKTLAGYAMFAPVTGSGSDTPKIELIVETASGGTQTVEVNAPANNITNYSSTINGFLAGYSYVVTLKFGSAGIAPSVSVTAWKDGTDPGEVTV